jgi:hypothetical protein
MFTVPIYVAIKAYLDAVQKNESVVSFFHQVIQVVQPHSRTLGNSRITHSIAKRSINHLHAYASLSLESFELPGC